MDIVTTEMLTRKVNYLNEISGGTYTLSYWKNTCGGGVRIEDNKGYRNITPTRGTKRRCAEMIDAMTYAILESRNLSGGHILKP